MLKALQMCKGDVENATDLLLNQGDAIGQTQSSPMSKTHSDRTAENSR